MIGYETTYILRSDTTDDSQKAFLEKLKGIVKAHGGEVHVVEDWGRRKLAYAIQKESKGHYIYLLYSGNNSLVSELERNMRINEQVLRFLTVKLESDFDFSKQKRKPTVNVAGPVAVTVAHA